MGFLLARSFYVSASGPARVQQTAAASVVPRRDFWDSSYRRDRPSPVTRYARGERPVPAAFETFMQGAASDQALTRTARSSLTHARHGSRSILQNRPLKPRPRTGARLTNRPFTSPKPRHGSENASAM